MLPKIKKLIINADDFGLCPSVSQGILDCYLKGIVSDFSFIINPDTYTDSLALLRKHDIRRCGIHFNLTLGRSYFKATKYITDDAGNYLSAKQHFINTFFRKLSEDTVYSELRNQMQLLLNDGIEITHFDTHQNVHILPPVYKALKKLSLENGQIPIRIPREQIIISNQYQYSNLKRIMIFNFFSFLIKDLSKNGTNVQATGGDFYNNPYPGKVIDNVFRYISSDKHNTIYELAVHPGYYSEEILRYDPYARQRETELKLLIDRSNLPTNDHIHLTNFGDLHSTAN